MKSVFPFSAVILDMDGLLVDTEQLIHRMWAKAAADYGFTIPEAVYLTLVGTTRESTKLRLQAAMGADFPYDDICSKRDRYYEAHLEQFGIPVKQGAVELLEALNDAAVPCVLATSTRRTAALRCLEKTGLHVYFSEIACGDEVERGKPAPDIFVLAANKAGAAPACCLVLEDSPAGIRAAFAAGMKCIMVPDIVPADAELQTLSWRILPSLVDVKACLFDGHAQTAGEI